MSGFPRLGQLAVAMCVVIGTPALAAGAGREPPPRAGAVRPAPWQGEARLDRPVSFRDDGVTVADLLSRVSATTGVPLACDAPPGRVQVAVCAESRPAWEVLAHLCDAVGASWEVAEGDAGGYRLRGRATAPTSGDVHERLFALEDEARQFDSLWYRQARESCLRRYRAALTPSGPQPPATEPDARLRADLLEEKRRGMLPLLLWLSPEQTGELLTRGTVGFPLADLPGPVRRHLAEWAGGRWGGLGGASMPIDPDRPSRFARPEDRWQNSAVFLTWTREALQLDLLVPDVYRFGIDLAHLGAPDGTAPGGTASAGAAPAATSGDARLALPVSLEGLADARPSMSRVVISLGEQCHVPVVAVCLPQATVEVGRAPKGGIGAAGSPTSLGEALEWLRAARHGAWSWRVTDGWLVARDEMADLLLWADPPEAVVEEWRARCERARAASLDDLADLAATLNPLQLHGLAARVPGLRQIATDYLWLYGALTREQRQALLRGETVAIAGLAPQQQRMAWRHARSTHPWFALADLGKAVLRLAHQTLSTEEPGLSLVLEYHRPESPQDRDIIFTMPEEFRWPAKEGDRP